MDRDRDPLSVEGCRQAGSEVAVSGVIERVVRRLRSSADSSLSEHFETATGTETEVETETKT